MADTGERLPDRMLARELGAIQQKAAGAKL